MSLENNNDDGNKKEKRIENHFGKLWTIRAFILF